MGAISKLDLTSEVTHLIIGDIDTPKYRYVAKEREDVKVLLPGWIHAVREKWMSGSDNLDLFTLEREYRAPTFYKLRICITGFDDLATRKNIEEIANMNGAVYKGDLSKDITHLIAHSTHLAKYTYAKQWGLKVVALEWFQQSLDRGMVLDERLYDPLMERRERGKGAWQRKSPTATNLGKRQRGDNSPLTTTAAQSRRLRRSASSRFDSQNDGLWTNIVAAVPQAPRTNTTSEWDDNGGGQVNGHEFRRPTTATNTRHPEELPQMPSKPKGIFFETLFVLYGFDEKKVGCCKLGVRGILTRYRQQYFRSIFSLTMVLSLLH